MAKKYLLYIHDERFLEEPEKSKLVNRLLAEHYALPELRKEPLWPTTKEKPGTKPKEAAVSVSLGNVSETAKSLSEEKGYDFCKHDQVKGFCKKGCV